MGNGANGQRHLSAGNTLYGKMRGILLNKGSESETLYEELNAGYIHKEHSISINENEELAPAVSRDSEDEAVRRVHAKLTAVALVFLRVLVDIVAYIGAAWFAYWLRYSFTFTVGVIPAESVPPFKSVIILMLLCAPIFILYMKGFGMYNVRRYVGILDSIPRIFIAANSFVLTLLLIVFLLKIEYISRGYMVFFWFLILIFTFFCRTMLKTVLAIGGQHYVMDRNALIIGAGNVGKLVAIKMRKHKHFGLNPVGFLDNDPLYMEFEEEEIKDLKVLGGSDDIYAQIMKHNIDEVIIAFTGDSHGDLLDLSVQCNKAGVECSVVPRLYEAITDEITVNEIGGVPLLGLPKVEIKGFNHIMKTLEDYILTIFILLLIWPVMLITAIAVKLDSKGPVLFAQTRVGKNGKPFKFYKFRSMVENAEAMKAEIAKAYNRDWFYFKLKDDPRITKVGKFIRKTSLDELPQFFCVLAGNMSIVGPRPALPSEVAEFEEWHKLRLNVKPGITGPWQVSGRSDLPYDEMVKLDLYYAENWSLWHDAKILIKTLAAVLTTKGAY